MIHTKEALSGQIEILVTQQVRPLDTYFKDTFDLAGTGLTPASFTRTLHGSCTFQTPEKGNLIEVYGAPKIVPEKITAKSNKEAAQKIAGNFGLSGSLVSAGVSLEDSTSTSTGVDREYSIEVLVKDPDTRFFVLSLKAGSPPS